MCAFAAWASKNSAALRGEAGRALVLRVLSRIRFPDIPAPLLLAYWDGYSWLQKFHPDKELIIKAMSLCALIILT